MNYPIFLILLLAETSFAQINWVQTNGPNTGLVNRVIVDSSNNIYVGTSVTGVYRSTDEGNHWHELNDSLFGTEITSMTCGPDSELYVGTYIPASISILASLKEDNTWHSVLPKLPYRGDTFLHKTKKKTLLVGTFKDGLYRIDYKADTIVKSDSGILQNHVNNIVEASNGDIYLTTRYSISAIAEIGLYKSSDDGHSWISLTQKQADFSGYTSGYFSSLFVFESNGDRIILAGSSGDGASGGHLFKSIDEGTSWDSTKMEGPVSNILIYNDKLYCTSSGKIFTSTDAGYSWDSDDDSIVFPYLSSLAITKTGHLLGGSNGGGVYILSEGDNWRPLTEGLPNANVSSIAVTSIDTLYAGTLAAGVSVSIDGGKTWRHSNSGLNGYYVTSIVNTSKALYAGTHNGVYVSYNSAEQWKRVIDGPALVTSMQLSKFDKIYISSGDKRYIINNGDSNASIVPTLLRTNIGQMVRGPKLDLYAMGRAEYIDHKGNPITIVGLCRANGDGDDFGFVQTSGPEIQGGVVGCIDTFLFSTGSKLRRSSDYGRTWIDVEAPLAEGNNFLTSNNRLFLGTQYAGMFMSLDSGITWQNISGGLTNGYVGCLAQDSAGYLYLGTSDEMKGIKGGGVFKTKAPAKDMLNIPRPHQANTQIIKINININNRYLQIPDDVQHIRICDELGREVYKDNHSKMNIDLYGMLQSSGLYFIELHKGDIIVFATVLLSK